MDYPPTYGKLTDMSSSEAVANTVGRRVRDLRQQRRMTIDALAAASGVSRGTVIQIEAGRGNPSVTTLSNLANALGAEITSLFDGDVEPHIVIRRESEITPLWISAVGSSAAMIIGLHPPTLLELWKWTLQPGDSFVSEAHSIGTIKLLLVLSGLLELWVGTTNQRLSGGDTVMFQAHTSHRYIGGGDESTHFILMVLQPSVTKLSYK